MSLRIALVGYGKMGKLIESLAPEYDAEIVVRLDEHNNANGAALVPDTFQQVDVAIEFTTPEVAVGNIERLIQLRVPTVVGTTGWTEHLERVKSLVESSDASLVWSPNFSIGVNVFFKVIEHAAQLLAKQSEYGAWAWEIHHDAKKDAPSGTLLKLIEQMRAAGYQRNIDVSSNRAGKVPGTHEIGFDSQADTLTFRHTARSREGFARGALSAARWIQGKKGFRQFSDILFER
jgi:4-hydroxy-tetrahydrodipicolinate reductase